MVRFGLSNSKRRMCCSQGRSSPVHALTVVSGTQLNCSTHKCLRQAQVVSCDPYKSRESVINAISDETSKDMGGPLQQDGRDFLFYLAGKQHLPAFMQHVPCTAIT